jgi:hypothetical protein
MIEGLIAKLVREFQTNPVHFFHERELHAKFFGKCRHEFGTATTADGFAVPLFRYEYDSIWKYARHDPELFAHRLSDRGTTACLDFVLLRTDFVTGHRLLDVINKCEPRRRRFRDAVVWDIDNTSAAYEVGIEFKMAYRRCAESILQGQVNALSAGMRLDARKLAVERVRIGYVLGFSHGPLPDNQSAVNVVHNTLQEYTARRENGVPTQLRVLLAKPGRTVLSQGWIDPADFVEHLVV